MIKNYLAKRNMRKLAVVSAVSAYAVVMMAMPASAALTLSFDVNAMFTYAQLIIDALMPVLYITLGIALGFIVIRALKSAFS